MSITYNVKGLNKFIQNIKKDTAQKEKLVGQEIQRSALRIERQAKIWAPWDTGWLANNIYSNMVNLMNAEVVSPIEYSIYLELGTRYMAAQPFLYPAVQADVEILFRNLNKIVKG